MPAVNDGVAETEEGLRFVQDAQDFKAQVADLPERPNYLDLVAWEMEPGVTTYFQILGTASERATASLGSFRDSLTIHTKKIAPLQDPPAGYGNADGKAYGNPDEVSYGSAGN